MKHAAGETSQDWANLSMKVAEHFVRAPAPNETDDVGVYTCAEEGVGARGAEATGRYIGGKEAKRGPEETNG